MVGGTQVLKLPPAKSFRTASTDCDARVSARKLPKHGAWPPYSWSRSTPPSKKDSTGIGLLVPLVNLSSNVQVLGVKAEVFVTAQALSSTGATVHSWVEEPRLWSVPLISPPVPTHSRSWMNDVV